MAGTSKRGTASAGPAEASEGDPEGAKLTVLYDETCSFCRRCRDWLLAQPCFIEVELPRRGHPPPGSGTRLSPGSGRSSLRWTKPGGHGSGRPRSSRACGPRFGTGSGRTACASPGWLRWRNASSGSSPGDGTGGAPGWAATSQSAPGATRIACGGRTLDRLGLGAGLTCDGTSEAEPVQTSARAVGLHLPRSLRRTEERLGESPDWRKRLRLLRVSGTWTFAPGPPRLLPAAGVYGRGHFSLCSFWLRPS